MVTRLEGYGVQRFFKVIQNRNGSHEDNTIISDGSKLKANVHVMDFFSGDSDVGEANQQ